MTDTCVAITGIGAIGPGFFDLEGLSRVLEKGEIPCSPITRFSTQRFKSKLAFQIDLAKFFRVAEQELASTTLIARYGHHALKQALAIADISPDEMEPICIFGTAVAGSWEMEAAYGSLGSFTNIDNKLLSASDVVSFSRPAEQIFAGLNKGSPCVVSTGCTASIDALGVGWMRVLEGAEVVLVVASEAAITPMVLTCFERIGALTRETILTENASQPFGIQRSGFCLGEGSAAVVLEPLRHAQRRGARILSSLHSYATTSSAFHMTGIAPSGEAIYRSLRSAMEMASLDPADVALLVPHATSTPQNDLAEYNALCNLFHDLSEIPIYCGKANFGHALGASNLIEIVATVVMLTTGVVAPYPNRINRDIEFQELLLPEKPVPLRGRIAVKNSSGFSGIHSAVVLEGLPCI